MNCAKIRIPSRGVLQRGVLRPSCHESVHWTGAGGTRSVSGRVLPDSIEKTIEGGEAIKR